MDEFLSSLPVVESNNAMPLFVAEAGPTTSPEALSVAHVGATPAPADVRTWPDVPAAEPPIFMSPQNLLLVLDELPQVFSLLTVAEDPVAA